MSQHIKQLCHEDFCLNAIVQLGRVGSNNVAAKGDMNRRLKLVKNGNIVS